MHKSIVILSVTSPAGNAVIVATGFAYDEDRVATAAHFCIEATRYKVLKKHTINASQKINGHTKKFSGLSVDEISESSDVCLITMNNHMLTPLPVIKNYDDGISVGDSVTIIGAPSGIAVGSFGGEILELHIEFRGDNEFIEFEKLDNLQIELREDFLDAIANIRDAFLSFDWSGTALKKEFGKQADRFIPITFKSFWRDVRVIQEQNGVVYSQKSLKGLKLKKKKKKKKKK